MKPATTARFWLTPVLDLIWKALFRFEPKLRFDMFSINELVIVMLVALSIWISPASY